MIARERLYVTADRQKAVREGDKKAAFLLVAEGQEILEVVAKQYGIVDGRVKQHEKAANKMADKPVNKSKFKNMEDDDGRSKANTTEVK
jgi:hypothetical protein